MDLLVVGRLNQDGTVRNDKWLHCVVGSEIARVTSFQVADYVAWFKEFQDLTDTRFESDDYTASVDGARQTTLERTCEECSQVCEDRWGDRYAPWDGTSPPAQRNQRHEVTDSNHEKG